MLKIMQSITKKGKFVSMDTNQHVISISQAAVDCSLQGCQRKPMQKCQKQQFIEWPLEAPEVRQSLFTPVIKMPNFTAEINMFTAWYKKYFGLYSNKTWSIIRP